MLFFVIPPDLDTSMPNPQKMAEAITQFWAPNIVTDTLKPILVKLLEIGQQFPEHEKIQEEISDSVYVMY